MPSGSRTGPQTKERPDPVIRSRILDLAVEKGLVSKEALGELEEAVSTAPPATGDASQVATIPDAIRQRTGEPRSLPPHLAGGLLGDRYAVGGLIGQGAMGRVHRAFDLVLKRPVAIKILQGRAAGEIDRFIQEARAQARVDHPNVCKVFDAGLQGDTPYIAMQLIEGVNLKAASRGLSIEQRVALVASAADGVHAANRMGLVHRDVKPSNILVEQGDDGRLKPCVLDFGLVRDLENPGLTISGVTVGTPAYMAPEQARGDTAAIDRRTDVYGLGGTLYELLAGSPPFVAGSAMEAMIRTLQEDPVPLRKRGVNIPANLQTILSKALEKDPGRRYESARAFAEDLRRFLDGEEILGRRPGVLERIVRLARKQKTALRVSLVSFIIVAATLVVGARARFAAREQIRITQQLGQDVAAIESAIRHSYMLPRHDVSPDLAAANAQIKDLEAKIQELGPVARGPGNYALGRALLALREWRPAFVRLDRAWQDGFRDPHVAYAFGNACGRLYEKALEEARRLPNPRMREQRITEAERVFRQRALKLLTASATAKRDAPEFLDALLAYYDGKPERALERAEAALRRLPWLWEALDLEASVLRDQTEAARLSGRFDDAWRSLGAEEAVLARAEAIARSSPVILDRVCRNRVHRMQVALESSRDVPSLFADAEAACRAALSVRVTASGHNLLARGNWYLAEYRMPRGQDPRPALMAMIDHSRQAALLSPGEAHGWNNLGLAHYNLGEFLRRGGADPRPEYEEAVTSLSVASRLDPAMDYIKNNLGMLHSATALWESEHGIDALPRYRLSIENYRAAAAAAKTWSLPLSNLGVVLVEVADYEALRGQDPRPYLTEAIASLNRSIEINPSDKRAYNNLGWAERVAANSAWSRGEDPQTHMKKAEGAFRKATKLDPQYALAWDNLGEICRRWAEIKLKRGEDPEPRALEALGYFGKAKEINPAYADAVLGVGEIHRVLAASAVEKGQDPRLHAAAALEALDHALKLKQDLAQAYEEKGRVYFILAKSQGAGRAAFEKSIARAEAALRKGLELNPALVDSFYLMGEIALLKARRASGRGQDPARFVSEARNFGDEAHKRNPSDVDVKRLRAEIEKLVRR